MQHTLITLLYWSQTT